MPDNECIVVTLFETPTLLDDGPTLVAGELSLKDRERLEPILDEFEQDLLRGNTPAIETWLKKVDESEHSYVVQQLVKMEVGHQLGSGSSPDKNNYVGRFPNYATQIEFVFDDLASDHPEIAETVLYDGHAARPQQEFIVPGLRIVKHLGRGGFADVYHCFDEGLQTDRAVKIPRRDKQFTEFELKSFKHEAQQLQKCNGISNVVNVYHVGETKDRLVRVHSLRA